MHKFNHYYSKAAKLTRKRLVGGLGLLLYLSNRSEDGSFIIGRRLADNNFGQFAYEGKRHSLTKLLVELEVIEVIQPAKFIIRRSATYRFIHRPDFEPMMPEEAQKCIDVWRQKTESREAGIKEVKEFHQKSNFEQFKESKINYRLPYKSYMARIWHPICQLSKSDRKKLKVDGLDTDFCDIKSSHPRVIIGLVGQSSPQDEVDKFKEAIEQPDFYQKYGGKGKFFEMLFWNEDGWKYKLTECWKIFAEEYPGIAANLERLRASLESSSIKNAFCRLIQGIEANAMRKIARMVSNLGHYCTIVYDEIIHTGDESINKMIRETYDKEIGYA